MQGANDGRQTAKKSKKKIVFYLIPILIFVGFISYMTIRTYTGEVKAAVTETTLSAEGFENLSDSFEDVLQENMYAKDEYINLNGLTTNVLGINSLNDVQKLANGQLTDFGKSADISNSSASVIELNEFLNSQGIDFIYLSAPSKNGFYNVEYSPGYETSNKSSYDAMIDTLDKAGVKTIYMNNWYEENSWTMDDVYFKTDHHWLPQAALSAANLTMEMLVEDGSIDGYDQDQFKKESYTITTLEKWFLGWQGKRVGILYGGIDDIDVYIPNFETEYSFAKLNSGTTNWDYSDSPLNENYIENKDLFGTNTYYIYMYGDNPIQVITNTAASIDKRVLVTGNSYRAPYQYFLSTQFKENYYIDLRHYSDGTFIQFVEEIQPDIIIMCSNSLNNEQLFNFGVEEYLSALELTSTSDMEVNDLGNVAIEAQEDNNGNFTVLCNNLEPGQTYTITVDSTSYSGGKDLFVQMTLQNLSTNTAVYNRYFDANNDETQKWIFTVPDNANGNYVIYLYAGTKGHTKNVSVEVKNITLRKGVFED